MKKIIIILLLSVTAIHKTICFGQTNNLFEDDILITNILPSSISNNTSQNIIQNWRKFLISEKVKLVKQTNYSFEYGEKIENKNFLIERYDESGKLFEKQKLFVRNVAGGTNIESKCLYQFNSNGKVKQVACLDSSIYSKQARRVSYSYDDKNLLLSEISEQGNGEVMIWEITNFKKEYEKTYTYNDKGSLIEENKKNSGGYNPTKIKYEYDDKGNTIKKVVFLNDGVYQKNTFEYEIDGKLKLINALDKKKDILRPLVAIKYSKLGNVLLEEHYYEESEYSFNWVDKVLVSFVFEYDINNNLSEIKLFGVDKTKIKENWKYKYDNKNQLIEVTQFINNKPVLVVNNEYSY